MRIYFAGSIRGGRQDKELYMQLIEHCQKHGEVLTEHIGDKTLSTLGEDGPDDAYIYARDMAWLDAADVVVAEVTQPSLGVGYEIGWAESRKPVLCLYRETKGRRPSAMISGNEKLAFHMYGNVHEAKKIIDEFLVA